MASEFVSGLLAELDKVKPKCPTHRISLVEDVQATTDQIIEFLSCPICPYSQLIRVTNDIC